MQWRKGRLATHLVATCVPKLPQKKAQEGNYHGDDEGGKGEDGDAVQ